MNNLSWFIYFVQLVDAATTVSIWAAILVGAHFAIRTAATVVRAESAWIECSGGARESREARASVWRAFQPRVFLHASLFLIFVTVSAIIPSRQTMLLVAGSEMGEQAIKSDAVQSVVNPGMDLVKLWIKQETDKLKKKAE